MKAARQDTGPAALEFKNDGNDRMIVRRFMDDDFFRRCPSSALPRIVARIFKSEHNESKLWNSFLMMTPMSCSLANQHVKSLRSDEVRIETPHQSVLD